MRIPFPERFSIWHALCFATVLCTAQLIEGTAPTFSLCCFLFILIATFAFNVAGGFTRPSGGYIFFYAFLGAILGLCWKAVLGEPADSNLQLPIRTILVFLGGISAMLASVYISRKLTTKRAILGSLVTDANMQNATLGCMFTGLVLLTIFLTVPFKSGSILSALGQVNHFLPMAVILGVIHEIRKSGGTRSINLPVLVSGALIFGAGLFGFSKEGMFTPLICWFVAAGSQRYKLSIYQILGGLLTIFFMFHYLVPYSQYGRQFRSDTGSLVDQAEAAVFLLGHLDYVREQYKESEEGNYEERIQGYFDSPQGFFDRLQMISVDDSLIAVTEHGHVFGLSPILLSFENYVPHALWPDKPFIYLGNTYAHEIGIIMEDDISTGISFTPTGDAYHEARWLGVFIVAPILWIMLFTLFDSLCGDVYHSPWGLLMIAIFSHIAPEGMLAGVIYLLGFGSVIIIVAALSAAYVMPILGTFIAGPEPLSVRLARPIRSLPRSRPPVLPLNR